MPDKETEPKATPAPKDRALEKLRINRAFQLAVVGLGIAAGLVCALLVAGWKQAADITAVVGLFTSVLGTLVGLFFGVQIGSADKEKVEERADTAQKKANALQAGADQGSLDRAKKLYPDLFK
jgi:hypothetical protein